MHRALGARHANGKGISWVFAAQPRADRKKAVSNFSNREWEPMRQGQQNRRGRGRNRKGHQNPLTRSFESNGPDVKIRGTPAHIAEKYISLARDALSSGDPVLAENYLQHAEHYNRIIMAYREQQMQQSVETMNGGMGRPRLLQGGEGLELADEFADEEADNLQPEMPVQPVRGQEPQPRMPEAQPRFDNRQQRQPQGPGRPPREPFPRERERPHPDLAAAEAPSADQPRGEGLQRRRERFVHTNEQPEFLRRSVRRPRRESEENSEPSEAGAPNKENGDNLDKSSA
jgi:hypothetical protein